jgi:hypothetical protein
MERTAYRVKAVFHIDWPKRYPAAAEVNWTNQT